jgi:LacI family transcriptional regulator
MQLGKWLKLKHPPTAIFSLNELTSINLLRALAAHKVSIPGQIAIVGFDDVQLAELLKPALTVVRQPAQGLGTQAASLLVERINASTEPPRRRIFLETEFIIRSSCGCNGS